MTVIIYKSRNGTYSFKKKYEDDELFYCEGGFDELITDRKTLDDYIAMIDNGDYVKGSCGYRSPPTTEPVKIIQNYNRESDYKPQDDNRVKFSFICPHCGYMWTVSLSPEKFRNVDEIMKYKDDSLMGCPKCKTETCCTAVRF